MSRVTYTEKKPGDPRDGAWLTSYFADLAAATGSIDRSNLREEGIRRPALGVPAAYSPFDAVLNTNAAQVAPQVWGPLPGALRTRFVGNFHLKPDEMLRVRAGFDCPSTAGTPGISFDDLVELRITSTKDGVTDLDSFSEVWHMPGNVFDGLAGPVNVVSSNGLTTFATWANGTGVDQVFTAIEAEAQVTTNVTDPRIGFIYLIGTVFRRIGH